MRPDDLGSHDDLAPARGGVGRPPRDLPEQAPGSDTPRHLAIVQPPAGRLVLLAPQAAAGPRPLLAHPARANLPRLLGRTRGGDDAHEGRSADFPWLAPLGDADPASSREDW